MTGKNTGDLQAGLMRQSNLDSYLSENREQFVNHSIAELLLRLFDQSGVSKAAVARNGCMSEVYLYQVLSGRRNPSRDRLLCICVGLGITLEQTQQLLKQAGYAPLYPKLRRDAIISHGIVHGTPLGKINDKLFDEDAKTLF